MKWKEVTSRLELNLARKLLNNSSGVNTIASHHGDGTECSIAVIVAAADALSAIRPGARMSHLKVTTGLSLQDLKKLQTA